MNILGMVTKTHDTGAAIVLDGRIGAVVEEERLNRDKHTQFFPDRALEAALATAGLDLRDIDAVTTPWDTSALRRSFRRAVTGGLPASLNLLRPAAHSAQNSGVVFLRSRLRQGLGRRLKGGRPPEIVEVAHHDAHAAIYFVSPFDDAAILVADGYGDTSATSLYAGRGDGIERLDALGFFDSIGALYSGLTIYLGFDLFEEGTVMALAATGGSTYVERFRRLVKLEEGGRFRLDPAYVSLHTHGLVRPFTTRFLAEFGPPRRRGEPLLDRHRDLAAALQKVTEETVLHVVRNLGRRTGSRNLCITGGVALNCVANARILEETGFERIWVPPVASDTGAPLGSALWHYHRTLGKPRCTTLSHAFHGAGFSDADVVAALADFGLESERMDEDALVERVATDLAAKRIAGWCQGRFEIGPRALGNRSILADPRDLAIKDILNARIKQREPFRPFAPAVLAERAHELFEIDQPDPFMTLAPRVVKARAGDIPAAVHVDGTARIETVERSANPRFYKLIQAFAKLTGIPVLLNTSFNRQEPIVSSPRDAISCYLRTRMDVLAVGDHYVIARTPEAEARAAREFEETRRRLERRRQGWRQLFES